MVLEPSGTNSLLLPSSLPSPRTPHPAQLLTYAESPRLASFPKDVGMTPSFSFSWPHCPVKHLPFARAAGINWV